MGMEKLKPNRASGKGKGREGREGDAGGPGPGSGTGSGLKYFGIRCVVGRPRTSGDARPYLEAGAAPVSVCPRAALPVCFPSLLLSVDSVLCARFRTRCCTPPWARARARVRDRKSYSRECRASGQPINRSTDQPLRADEQGRSSLPRGRCCASVGMPTCCTASLLPVTAASRDSVLCTRFRTRFCTPPYQPPPIL